MMINVTNIERVLAELAGGKILLVNDWWGIVQLTMFHEPLLNKKNYSKKKKERKKKTYVDHTWTFGKVAPLPNFLINSCNWVGVGFSTFSKNLFRIMSCSWLKIDLLFPDFGDFSNWQSTFSGHLWFAIVPSEILLLQKWHQFALFLTKSPWSLEVFSCSSDFLKFTWNIGYQYVC